MKRKHIKTGKSKRRLAKRQVDLGAGVYSKSNLTEEQTCYVMALINGLRIINEKAKEKRLNDEPQRRVSPKGEVSWGPSEIDRMVDGDALVHYVRRRGDYYVYIYGKDKVQH